MNANSSATNKNGLYLVTGTSGTGKSTACKELETRGVHTVDGDSIANWVERETGIIPTNTFPTDLAWVDKHFWVWDEKKMSALQAQAEQEIVVLAGSADHMGTYWHLFKQVFLLELSPIETKERVLGRKSHDYGKGEGQMERIFAWKYELSDLADTFGAARIDASPSPKVVAGSILEQL